MKEQTALVFLRRSAAALTGAVATILLLMGSGCATAPRDNGIPPAEFSSTSKRLFDLVDGASYSSADKESLKKGLSVAIPSVTSNEMSMAHVSQETVDIQIKNLHTNFPAALTLISNVAQCLEDQGKEFVDSKTFQRLPLADRDEVLAYLSEAVEQYRARAYETLLQHKEHFVTVPAAIPQSLTNAQYRELLGMAVKATQEIQPALAEKYYTIKEGDSLAGIARQHKVSSTAIREANPGLNPIRMKVGQIIVVPPPSAKSRAQTKEPSKG